MTAGAGEGTERRDVWVGMWGRTVGGGGVRITHVPHVHVSMSETASGIRLGRTDCKIRIKGQSRMQALQGCCL